MLTQRVFFLFSSNQRKFYCMNVKIKENKLFSAGVYTNFFSLFIFFIIGLVNYHYKNLSWAFSCTYSTKTSHIFPNHLAVFIMSDSTSNVNMYECEGELRRGPWTLEEDNLLIQYISCHGEGRWNSLAKFAGIFHTSNLCILLFIVKKKNKNSIFGCVQGWREQGRVADWDGWII